LLGEGEGEAATPRQLPFLCMNCLSRVSHRHELSAQPVKNSNNNALRYIFTFCISSIYGLNFLEGAQEWCRDFG
jgi:hypothetical protein